MNKHKLVGLKGKRAFRCVKCDKPFAKNKELLQHKASMHRAWPSSVLGRMAAVSVVSTSRCRRIWGST